MTTPVRALLIDNYDSFTWNLAHLLAQALGTEPMVVKNDAHSWADLARMGPFDCVVLSPGPGTPLRASDLGVCVDAIKYTQVPLLGVCLGHQAIAHVHGGRIEHAPEPIHGRLSLVHLSADPLFVDIPPECSVVRYHSWSVAQPLPPTLMPIACTPSGLLMGLRHRQRPLWGVQFHPESVCTEHGTVLMRNFRDIAYQAKPKKSVTVCVAPTPYTQPPPAVPIKKNVYWTPLDTPLEAVDLFCGLYGDAPHAFWLDSAQVTAGVSRYSFMGAASAQNVQTLHIDPKFGDTDPNGIAFLNTLQTRLHTHTQDHPPTANASLPFEFRGGWVGYFGYEANALFEPNSHAAGLTKHPNPYPDAAWMYIERFIAIDHTTGQTWAVALADADDEAAQTQALTTLSDWRARIALLAPIPPLPAVSNPVNTNDVPLKNDHTRAEYLEAIAACQQAIRDGECYQVCLSSRLRYEGDVDALTLYRVLRAHNPAPFCAYLRLGDVALLSTSPERFLSVNRQRRIETKPIKGTAMRSADPVQDRMLAHTLAHSEKNRAENLMIVDLMRNDLSRVADVGSVHVPQMMYIESYANVHQLLSTVHARLGDAHSLIDLIGATFAGGSVTGAPKRRAMQWIARLERSARGAYCGAIGYLGFNDVMDLSIAIRTAVHHNGCLHIGAGGGITHLSDPAAEYDEIVLKAARLLEGLAQYLQLDDQTTLKTDTHWKHESNER